MRNRKSGKMGKRQIEKGRTGGKLKTDIGRKRRERKKEYINGQKNEREKGGVRSKILK